jgi:hypothetical protein
MEFGVLFHDRRLQAMECFVSKSRVQTGRVP